MLATNSSMSATRSMVRRVRAEGLGYGRQLVTKLSRWVGELERHQDGILVVSLGAHYNDQSALNEYREKGVEIIISQYSRSHMIEDLRAVRGLLLRLTARCTRCSAVYITVSAQHFNSGTGAYPPDLSTNESSGSKRKEPIYPCRPLQGTSQKSGPLEPDSSPWTGTWNRFLGNCSANSWRVDEAIHALLGHTRQQGPAQQVTVVPLHVLSWNWWDLHKGGAGPNPDCTHHCYNPFYLEPVWMALKMASSLATEYNTKQYVGMVTPKLQNKLVHLT